MKIIYLIFALLIVSCEKDSPSCYTCKTMVNGEMMTETVMCYIMADELQDIKIGMQIQATAIYNSPAEINCTKLNQ